MFLYSVLKFISLLLLFFLNGQKKPKSRRSGAAEALRSVTNLLVDAARPTSVSAKNLYLDLGCCYLFGVIDIVRVGWI